MATSLSAYQVADLCLGKPPLRSLSSSATIATSLKSSPDTFLSVWTCDLCVTKICIADIICYLCKKENASSPASSLNQPLSLLLSHSTTRVTLIDPSASLLEAIDLMIEGAQNLVVPIRSSISSSRRKRSSATAIHEFCWLMQEDVVTFLLSSIGLFSPIVTLPIETLGVITPNFLSVEYNRAAASAIGAISRSLAEQTSVAVVDGEGGLIGEISPLALSCCDETAAAAVMMLSAGDQMAYVGKSKGLSRGFFAMFVISMVTGVFAVVTSLKAEVTELLPSYAILAGMVVILLLPLVVPAGEKVTETVRRRCFCGSRRRRSGGGGEGCGESCCGRCGSCG